MLLITMRCVIMSRPGSPDSDLIMNAHISYATRLPLQAALDRIGVYKAAFNKRFWGEAEVGMGLLGVTGLGTITEDSLAALDVRMVENLPQIPEDC